MPCHLRENLRSQWKADAPRRAQQAPGRRKRVSLSFQKITASRAKSPQAESKPDQEKPRKRAWILLDQFGFLRPIRGFSKGYGLTRAKNVALISNSVDMDPIRRR